MKKKKKKRVMASAVVATHVQAAVTETAQETAMDVQAVVIQLLVNTCKLQCLNDE